MNDSEFLTAKEVAERWQVDPGTLANWRANGTGPKYTKIGGAVRYSMQAIRDYELQEDKSK